MARVGINGFGRIGRLALRAAWGWPELEFVHVNEIGGDAGVAAHLLTFDSVHGRWPHESHGAGDQLVIDGVPIGYSKHKEIAATPWAAAGVDIVLEAIGKFRSPEQLAAYFAAGVKKVIVAAPVKGEALNVVMGVNDHWYDPDRHHLLTAASCTTNCLAPVVKVIHEGIGIRHGMITTIHSSTNTQSVHDQPHKDLRRARASSLSLVPTTTGSATAIVTEVNELLRAAANGPLRGIMAYETRPLVSIDFVSDPHSAIIDSLCTMVTNETQVKIYAWYDNEWGYANRYVELARKVAKLL